ncbi:MAG: tyrosine-type recombinase/integrase [Deltaproteobacteria bacterium]
MAYIYRRKKYYWVGYREGAKEIQKSLKVTSKDAAKILLAEYQLREARHYHGSNAILIDKNLQGLFEEFIRVRSGREKTRKWYEYCRDYFLEYCVDKNLQRVRDINISVIEEFYHKRKSEAPDGARSNMRALRALFNYAVKKGYAHSNPVKAVKIEKSVKKIFRDLSISEVKALFAAAKMHGRAYYPLFATAYYAGLRASELVYLEPGDINYKEGYVYVRSKKENPIKDHQERKIPLNNRLCKILTALRPTGKWLFETKNGTPRLNNLNREIKRIGRIADIDVKGLRLQVLRETFGSHLLRRKVSVYLVSKYLGHSSVDVTTRHYAHVPIEETHEEINLL